jgi:hypothetical protein
MEITPPAAQAVEASPSPVEQPRVAESRPQVTAVPPRPRHPADIPVPERGVTWRAILIGTLLIPINTYWIIQVEGIWHSNHATAMSLFWNTIFCLVVLVVMNLGLKQYAPRFAFSQGEFITIYVMITLASALAGHDSLQLGFPGLSFSFWFATPENRWGQLFNQYFPSWATVQNKEILKGLYQGADTLYRWDYLKAWIGPVMVWCFFITALGLVMICMNVIIRKQWTENEKLSYPIVQLPLALTAGGGSREFFRHKPLWYGIMLGGGLDILNGLHFFYPAVPGLVVRHDSPELNLGPMFNAFPWNSLQNMWLPLYPFIIGLGYFLPVDLSFSIWFFYLFRCALIVGSAAAGYRPGEPGNPPFLNQQSYGAWFAIVAYVLYISRGHLTAVWKTAFTREKLLDDSQEPMSYRAALIGVFIGQAMLTVFCLAAGMSLGMVLIFFAIFWVIAIGLTRVRAELGPPAHEIVGMNATNLMVMMMGSRAIGAPNLAMFTMFYWFTGRGYRSDPMPCQLEAFKMGEVSQMNMKGLGAVMIFAMFFGGLATYWSCLHLQYIAGVNHMTDHNWPQYDQLASRLQSPEPADWKGMAAMGVGFAWTMVMILARIRIPSWPFHPAGYALSLNFGVEYFWSCILISWLVKTLVIRYGGYKLNRQVMPFMFGLILGEYCVGAFWSALSVVTGIRTYDFAPG